jgi:hypothetical protein
MLRASLHYFSLCQRRFLLRFLPFLLFSDILGDFPVSFASALFNFTLFFFSFFLLHVSLLFLGDFLHRSKRAKRGFHRAELCFRSVCILLHGGKV